MKSGSLEVLCIADFLDTSRDQDRIIILFAGHAVDIDKEARNTIDNATETSQWVARNHYTSVIVVTSNYHMPRALAELGRVMPGVTLIPYSVVDNNVHLDRWWTFPGTTRLLISEYLKYLFANVRMRFEPVPADSGNRVSDANPS